MSDEAVRHRLKRVYAAFGESLSLPEDIPATVREVDSGVVIGQDFTMGKTAEEAEVDGFKVINEIMGIRDRAKKWIESIGGDPKRVDKFIKSEISVALVHDLANADKHYELDRAPFSGYKPRLSKLSWGMTGVYDPATGSYVPESQYTSFVIDTWTGQLAGKGSSTGMEVALTGEILDDAGNVVGDLHKVLSDAVYKWERFLVDEGLQIP